MNRLLLLGVSALILLGLSACEKKQPGPSTTGKICHIVGGDNDGRQGRYDDEGSCCDADEDGNEVPGSWGCTDCKSDKTGGSCKDGPKPTSGTAGDGSGGSGLVDPGSAIVGTVPAFGSAPTSFCNRSNEGLVLTFQNTGTATSGLATVSVTFRVADNDVVTETERPTIPAGQSIEVTVPIPAGCFSPDCPFSFSWANQPAHVGLCIG
ncbi:MAG: hypothetical protein AAGH76_03450 [Pseudomonadota bacterium]